MFTFVLTLLAASPAGGEASCDLAESERAAILALDYEAFDQTPGGGWRTPFAAGCNRAAATLIQDYIDANGAELPPDSVSTMRFHAGQVLAMGGFDAEAAPHVAAALDAPGLDEAWVAYLSATRAFLDKDADAFADARDAYVDAAGEGAPRVRVIDSLGRCFEGTYAQALHGACESDADD